MINHGSGCAVIHSPAKLNLFLEVLARRDDGYHEIETLMVPVAIFDTLRFSTISGNQVRLTCQWSYGRKVRAETSTRASIRAAHVQDGSQSPLGDLPTGADNIVLQAVDLLRQRANVNIGATMQLRKRIPSAAGLGGASSNAAAALAAANAAWRLGWSHAQLAELSAELGSDIPFFFSGGAAICRGRGERIEPTDMPRLHAVVVKPPDGLSTPKVYRACQVPAQPRSAAALLDAGRRGESIELARETFNRLQEPARRLSPWIDRLANEFERLHCLGHQMSGSGSSYFGLCRNARHARRVASRLRAVGFATVYSTSSYSARPLRQ